MTNYPWEPHDVQASGRDKLYLEVRSDGEICHGEQAHADVGDIDAESVQRSSAGKYLHGRVQELPCAAAAVGPDVEEHRGGQRSLAARAGKDYGRAIVECGLGRGDCGGEAVCH